VAAIAEKQQGAIARSQLAGSGLTRFEINCWISSERILRTQARDVFRMPGAEQTWRQALWVAVLAGPKRTVVSHLSAAGLWGLVPPPERPHVTVGRGSSGRIRGSVVHHAALDSSDRCLFQRFPVTSVARTIVDCAPLLDQAALERLVDAAIGRGLCRYRQIRAAQRRAGRVRGGGRLTEALGPYAGGARPRSEKEAHVLRLFHSWGLPPPECQYVIRDERGRFVAKVDFGWAPWRFGMEYDGDESHSPRRWRHDDRRQAAVERMDWRIERADRFDTRPSSLRLRNLLTSVLLQPPPFASASPDPALFDPDADFSGRCRRDAA
jgi:hypothetical protein